jgi:hypothetical protein
MYVVTIVALPLTGPSTIPFRHISPRCWQPYVPQACDFGKLLMLYFTLVLTVQSASLLPDMSILHLAHAVSSSCRPAGFDQPLQKGGA